MLLDKQMRRVMNEWLGWDGEAPAFHVSDEFPSVFSSNGEMYGAELMPDPRVDLSAAMRLGHYLCRKYELNIDAMNEGQWALSNPDGITIDGMPLIPIGKDFCGTVCGAALMLMFPSEEASE